MNQHTKHGTIAALALLFCIGVHAQPGGAEASNGTNASNVKAMRAADRALQKNVRRALAKTKGLNVIDITVRARDGNVTLEGSVPEQSQVEQAARVAQGVAGVATVRNALIIHLPQ